MLNILVLGKFSPLAIPPIVALSEECLGFYLTTSWARPF